MPRPHQNQPLLTGGTPLKDAHAAVVLVHGRGATARSILPLGDELNLPGVAYLAPQAAENTWYPQSFLAPVEANEPGRTSGLHAIRNALTTAVDADIPTSSVVILGFSQGACLASEFAARNPTRYGGLAALSGGLIGESITPSEYEGDLDHTPVFLGCSDTDPHIPESRVHETARIFEHLNATVTTRIYPGMGHGVNQDELDHVTQMITTLTP